MKNSLLKFATYFSLVLLSLTFIGAANPSNFFNTDKTYIGLDSNSKTGMPNRFRDIPSLNISGSAQFTPAQITNLKAAINKPKICIVDLRQESHGFINDYAVSFFNPEKLLNNGLNSAEVLKKENSELSKIKIGSTQNIYSRSGRLLERVTVEYVSNEPDLVTANEMEYKLFPVRNNGTPSASVVDDFVEFIKNKPSDLHLHFHCDAGEGRTTSFMYMYQCMFNQNNLSMNQILTYQYNIGGIILTDDKDRAEFLQEFYNYTIENKSTNFTKSYSEWLNEV